jgi:hypothetical protein
MSYVPLLITNMTQHKVMSSIIRTMLNYTNLTLIII